MSAAPFAAGNNRAGVESCAAVVWHRMIDATKVATASGTTHERQGRISQLLQTTVVAESSAVG